MEAVRRTLVKIVNMINRGRQSLLSPAALPVALLLSLGSCGSDSPPSDLWALPTQTAAVLPNDVDAAAVHPPQLAEIAGRWGVQVRIPIAWTASLAVKGGKDELLNFLLMDVTSEAEPRVHYRMCGMDLPVTVKSVIPFERYQLEPDNQTFDGDGLAPVTDKPTVAEGNLGPTLSTRDLAFQVGVALHDPLAPSWPSNVDGLDRIGVRVTHLDGSLSGMPTRARTGGSFKQPPTTITMSTRLSHLFLAVRNVIKMDMTFTSAHAGTGTVAAQTYRDGDKERPMLNSLIVGAISTDSSGKPKACGRKTLELLNSSTPALTASAGEVRLVRLPDEAGCAAAREVSYP